MMRKFSCYYNMGHVDYPVSRGLNMLTVAPVEG